MDYTAIQFDVLLDHARNGTLHAVYARERENGSGYVLIADVGTKKLRILKQTRNTSKDAVFKSLDTIREKLFKLEVEKFEVIDLKTPDWRTRK